MRRLSFAMLLASARGGAAPSGSMQLAPTQPVCIIESAAEQVRDAAKKFGPSTEAYAQVWTRRVVQAYMQGSPREEGYDVCARGPRQRDPLELDHLSHHRALVDEILDACEDGAAGPSEQCAELEQSMHRLKISLGNWAESAA